MHFKEQGHVPGGNMLASRAGVLTLIQARSGKEG